MKRMGAWCKVVIGECANIHYVYGNSGDDYYLDILPNGKIYFSVIDNEGNKTYLHKDETLYTLENKIINDMLDAYYECVA